MTKASGIGGGLTSQQPAGADYRPGAARHNALVFQQTLLAPKIIGVVGANFVVGAARDQTMAPSAALRELVRTDTNDLLSLDDAFDAIVALHVALSAATNVPTHQTRAGEVQLNPAVQFVADCCTVDQDALISKSRLFTAFDIWQHEKGVVPPKRQAQFGHLLVSATGGAVRQTRLRRGPNGEQVPYYSGVDLTEDWAARVKTGVVRQTDL